MYVCVCVCFIYSLFRIPSWVVHIIIKTRVIHVHKRGINNNTFDKTKFETDGMENGDHKITFIKVKLKG